MRRHHDMGGLDAGPVEHRLAELGAVSLDRNLDRESVGIRGKADFLAVAARPVSCGGADDELGRIALPLKSSCKNRQIGTNFPVKQAKV